MFNNYAFLSGDLITDSIIFFIVLLFLEFTRRELCALARSKRLLKKIIEIKSKGKVNTLQLNILDDSQLVWITEHLIYIPKEKVFEIESQGGKWLSKSSVSQMMPTYDTARYRMIPALLTSLGITGTFIGITLGLHDFNLASDSEALLNSAVGLLGGMKTAFYTSLVGLSLSAFFMMVTKYCASSFSKSQAHLVAHLSRYYYEATSIYYLKQLADTFVKPVVVESSHGLSKKKKTVEKEKVAVSHENHLAQEVKLTKPESSSIELAAPIAPQTSESIVPNPSVLALDTDELGKKFYEAVNYAIQSTISPKLDVISQQMKETVNQKERQQKVALDALIEKLRAEISQPITKELSLIRSLPQPERSLEHPIATPSDAHESESFYKKSGSKVRQKIEIAIDEGGA